MSPNFEASLQLLAEKYDHVIIDTPPLLAVTDPAIISKQAGVILLVLKSGTHTRRVIEQSLKRLSGVGSTVSGVVFNDMAPNEGAAYGYSITYAYGEK